MEGETPTVPADYIKKEYIGSGIDPERDRKLRKLLSTEQQDRIRQECGEILRRFFPEEL